MTTAAALDHAAAGSSQTAARTSTPRRASARAKSWSSSVSPSCLEYVAKRTTGRASSLVIPLRRARLRVPRLHRGLERFVGIRRWRGHRHRVRLDLALQVGDRRVELSVLAEEGGVRLVVDDDVRIDTMSLDEPLPLRTVDARLRRSGRSEERRVGKECRCRWSLELV